MAHTARFENSSGMNEVFIKENYAVSDFDHQHTFTDMAKVCIIYVWTR